MRIKIIGDNNCARATRQLLRMAGFAVTEFLPVDAITAAPHFGYAITIELSPAQTTPQPPSMPGSPTNDPPAATSEETSEYGNAVSDVSSPSLERDGAASMYDSGLRTEVSARQIDGGTRGHIHFDSVDSPLENAILRHVTKLAAAPVIVDRPGGVVHSERELRILVPQSDDSKADEAAAVAVEFGVLRGLLDLVMPNQSTTLTDSSSGNSTMVSGARFLSADEPVRSGKKWWKLFIWILAFTAAVLNAAPVPVLVSHRVLSPRLALASQPAQGQFATGQQTKITDGTNTMVIDPCKAQTKLYVSINQTANAQLVAGTASKKIYVCSIHVVVAAATNVALVEGTGSVCATGTAGVSGFGGATAATGWNFAANGGIALGNGDAAVGAEGTNADNLCLFNSAAGQVSGGISYVVQ